ncbi:MAG TPA: 50S ribosomal protein L31 [Petrotogaceae bacterium]|jgi:large subunit ribosomal protein L31|nr:50S ribosomal protein L31 [Petrotogaceae bacterium]HOG35059.1 50S ribosomal protein L31 [Petrotogaceae bacterium]HPA93110.1 50S ribosomal protein L31 [Petrotogaceae bacterium]HPG47765.1 50S ribosomal protein L31 [Petrotogaceae bacterium]HPO26762.1 50S ribosomal protein L31 [Petrotogaceae bacterium]
MKKGIHPEMKFITVKCACGAEHKIYSTVDTFRLDVCSKCHPFFKGEIGSQILDTEGRVKKFNNRYKNFTQA